jgi:serine/threonine protein kinase
MQNGSIFCSLYLTIKLLQIRNEKARRYLSNMRKKPKVPFTKKFPGVDPMALHLLERLLAFDPKERPSAAEVGETDFCSP